MDSQWHLESSFACHSEEGDTFVNTSSINVNYHNIGHPAMLFVREGVTFLSKRDLEIHSG